MRIELSSLEGTDGKFSHNYAPGELALNDERVRVLGPLLVNGRVSRSRNRVVVKGQLSARVQAECDRCLKYVELPVETEFRVEYVTPQAYEAISDPELDESDMALSVFNGDVLDIDELVREQLLLAVPSRVLCQETCQGLCPICGSDRNIADCKCETKEADPRWGALRELVDGK